MTAKLIVTDVNEVLEWLGATHRPDLPSPAHCRGGILNVPVLRRGTHLLRSESFNDTEYCKVVVYRRDVVMFNGRPLHVWRHR